MSMSGDQILTYLIVRLFEIIFGVEMTLYHGVVV